MNNKNGFTLLELLVCLSLSALLMGIGVPAMSHYFQRQQADAAEAHLYRLIQTARNHAVTHNLNMHVCGSDDGTSCTKNWTKQAIIFHDTDDDSEPDSTEIVDLITTNITSAQIQTRIALGKTAVTVSPQGTATFTGSFLYCPTNQNPELYRRVTWNRLGRPYIGLDTNNDGRVEDTNGQGLTCD